MHLLTKWGLGAVNLSILAQLGLEIQETNSEPNIRRHAYQTKKIDNLSNQQDSRTRQRRKPPLWGIWSCKAQRDWQCLAEIRICYQNSKAETQNPRAVKWRPWAWREHFVVAIHLSSGRVSSNHVSQGCRLLNKKLIGSSVGKMGKIFDWQWCLSTQSCYRKLRKRKLDGD